MHNGGIMTTVIDVLGGARKLAARTDLEFEWRVREGLPASAYEAIAKRTEFSPSDLERLISRRTIGRAKARLSPEMSAKLARLARVWALAEETFQDRRIAREWFFEPVPGLGGVHPFTMLETESGARLVERELVRLAHGVVS
jgi:putative toxin-antitoxin system antitoxin component (TIGR02293 family)